MRSHAQTTVWSLDSYNGLDITYALDHNFPLESVCLGLVRAVHLRSEARE